MMRCIGPAETPDGVSLGPVWVNPTQVVSVWTTVNGTGTWVEMTGGVSYRVQRTAREVALDLAGHYDR